MWDPVLEALPAWRSYRYIVGVVNSPVGTGEDLLRHVGVNDNRIYGNIRQVARFVRPCKRAAVGSAGYLENMTGRWRRISVKAAYGYVPHG